MHPSKPASEKSASTPPWFWVRLCLKKNVWKIIIISIFSEKRWKVSSKKVSFWKGSLFYPTFLDPLYTLEEFLVDDSLPLLLEFLLRLFVLVLAELERLVVGLDREIYLTPENSNFIWLPTWEFEVRNLSSNLKFTSTAASRPDRTTWRSPDRTPRGSWRILFFND